MKKMLQLVKRNLVLSVMATFFVLGGISQSWAHDHDNHDGFWDHHHDYRHYEYYHHHRGYWDERSGFRIFINVG